MILTWFGASLAAVNWIVILVVTGVVVAAYRYRIEDEEKMLVSTLTGYADYRSHTWGLISLILLTNMSYCCAYCNNFSH